MIMKKRKLFCLLLITSILSLAASGCSQKSDNTASGGADKAHSYTYWIPLGEDASYYDSYDKNPGIEYLLQKNWKDKNGKDTKINLEFQIPAAGSAKDNLTTVISTGDYADVMDMTMYSGSINELYDDGIVLDLTPYMEEYMPNYMAFLDAHPDFKRTATSVIDGEKKFLQLYSYIDFNETWGGYCYRRDWIVKYGKNPADGSSFSGEYTMKKDDGTYDIDSWVDNVVFPSGGSDPIYISDWEWMLSIFQKAITDQGITDGYGMSLYAPGYVATGDLVSAFGGGGASWYKTPDNEIKYGLTDDNFRVYLQAMNKWYKNGWIDTAFPEHSADMFYAIDDVKVRQGKVGLWYGLLSQIIGRSDTGENFTKGMVVYAARQPINDIYGTDAQKNIAPYTFYSLGHESSKIVITDKANDKDLMALLNYLDYQYSPEGEILHSMGLNKEQYDVTQNEFMKKNGLTDGAYTDTVNTDGIHELEFVDAIKQNQNLKDPAVINRTWGLFGVGEGYAKVDKTQSETYKHNYDEWLVYSNTGYLYGSFMSQLSAEDAATISKINTNVSEFGAKNVPSFIQGTKDPNNDADWNAYIKAIGKYNSDQVTKLYQNVIDTLK